MAKAKNQGARKRRKSGSRAKRGPKRLPDQQVDEAWEAFEQDLGRKLAISRGLVEELAPFDQPAGILKRLVYSFVRTRLACGDGKKLDYLLWYKRKGEQRAHRISFEDNPFHWVLSAIPFEISELTRPSLSKVGRQLIYAHRHDIEPELLVGFLYQSGSPDVIAKKAKLITNREAWYLIKHSSRNDDPKGNV